MIDELLRMGPPSKEEKTKVETTVVPQIEKVEPMDTCKNIYFIISPN